MPIKYFDFLCENGHVFEGCFESVDEAERQLREGLVSCPMCDTPSVRRLPSAPHIAQGDRGDRAQRQALEQAVEGLMTAVRQAADKAEDVGQAFADESRRMKNGEAERRLIKGKCTLREAQELREEGIEVLPVPESSGKTLN